MNHSKQSNRTPGHTYRRLGVNSLNHQDEESMRKLEVRTNESVGLSNRSASEEDAKRIGDKPKPSPIL